MFKQVMSHLSPPYNHHSYRAGLVLGPLQKLPKCSTRKSCKESSWKCIDGKYECAKCKKGFELKDGRCKRGRSPPLQLIFDTSKGTGLAVTLELRGTVNVDIDWGDNSSIESVTSSGRTTHTYASAGIYTVKVTGFLTQFGPGTQTTPNTLKGRSNDVYSDFQGTPNIDKLVSVQSFGELGITSFSGAFFGATNLETVPATLPPGVTDMGSMFFQATSFNGDIGGWDVGKVTNMSYMFFQATSFNGDISGWDVGKVTDMGSMFADATSFNGDIGGWDVDKVTDMSDMFYLATSFNGDISGWDVGNVVGSCLLMPKPGH
jgi:surface protein